MDMVLREKYGSHNYDYELEHSQLFCLECGEKEVYKLKGNIDLDMGQEYYCMNCKKSFRFDGSYYKSQMIGIKGIEILTNK